MIKRLHPIAGTIACLTILAFWTSTVAAELSGAEAMIVAVKRAIPWGFLLLVPALAAAGASGFRIAGAASDPRIERKKRRMPIIAANGLLVLMPCAFWLRALAMQGELGTFFVVVQAVELAAGAVNIALLSLNMRDGFLLARRRPPVSAARGARVGPHRS